jgi:hypothetical protein
MIKTILAAVLAGAFLISMPVKAEEKAADSAGAKAEKSKKEKTDKTDKKDATKKDDKKAGGW